MTEPKPPEVRLNDDSTLDEIVGDGLFHLEQMDTDAWWMCFEQAGKRVDVWMHSEKPITVTYEESESTYRPAPVAADASKSVAAQDMDEWFAKAESAVKLYGDAEYQRAIASSDDDYEDACVNVDRAKDRLLSHLRARPAPVAAAPVIEQEPVNVQNVVAGALFDLMGYLTCRDKVMTLSSHHESGAAVEALQEWSKDRGFNLDDPSTLWRDHIHLPSGGSVAAQELTNEQIIEIRDSLLPSQGESFDCIAFARAILKWRDEPDVKRNPPTLVVG